MQLRYSKEKKPEPIRIAHALGLAGSPYADCTAALIMADLPEWWGARHSERMGNTPKQHQHTRACSSRAAIIDMRPEGYNPPTRLQTRYLNTERLAWVVMLWVEGTGW